MMSDAPKISIIMPVYNVEKYLRECLDSVRAQTFTDWECICVDDGSTDASPAILDEYAAKDPRFRVIKRKHSNAGACRNVGLDLAKGELLSFLDSDDVFEPLMFETMLRFLEETNSDIATCQHRHFMTVSDRIHPPDKRSCSPRVFDNPVNTVDIFQTWMSWAWDKLFRAELVRRNDLRFQEIASWNDMYFVDAALALAGRIVSLDPVFVWHRLHPTSIMATGSNKTCFAQALRCFHDKILEERDLKTNPNLAKSFQFAVLRNARFMLLNIKNASNMEPLFSATRSLLEDFSLIHIPRGSFSGYNDLLPFYSSLISANNTNEFLRKHFLAYERLYQIEHSSLYTIYRKSLSVLKIMRVALRICKPFFRLFNPIIHR